MQARIALIEDAVELLLRALGMIAQALHLIRRLGPGAMELDA